MKNIDLAILLLFIITVQSCVSCDSTERMNYRLENIEKILEKNK